ncbi:hypothetical protein [Dysgonomonas sp. ZJ279]|uniref:hypothetical protein n=1 Tax=Dysgonomonas sp. ZJ279 TaxID=2709796 RepID=UPI0013EA3577|nr:hypothetical protein [Dysgonomonas sp. ZJ279]
MKSIIKKINIREIFHKKILIPPSINRRHFRTILLGVTLLLVANEEAKAQEDYDFTLSSYPTYSYESFSKSNVDGIKGYPTSIIKTDILSIIDGDLPIIYEHRFSSLFAVEAGVGLILPYENEISTFPISAENNRNFKNTKFGYSLLAAPRIYFAHSSKNYMALMVRYRRYDELSIAEYGVGKGWVWLLADKYPLDAAVYASLSWQTPFGQTEATNNFRFKNSAFEDRGRGAVFALSFSLRFGIATR